ncbi:DNA (cytosine-5)-methyltransferase, putative [Plasmodium malariae]|uniref:DNA (Cytosine-5)-methyltransferase, putative n=1 Tax=Plasmodium malariae TaxID=5858 RepID=A0A1C3K9U5_PLAMA|nr:DNA (cytosine-5)-methyltransferase, putative [Plasmodium malariae]
MEKIKVLELYSGIGGLHFSLLQALINYVDNSGEDCNRGREVVQINDIKDIFHFISLDISPIANQTYYHNFKDSSIYLTSKKDINKFLKNVKSKSINKMYKKAGDSFISYEENKDTNNANNSGERDHLSANYIIQTDINNLSAPFFEYHKFTFLLISNPCQPYTRQNKKCKEINLKELCHKYNSTKGECPNVEKQKNKNNNENKKSHTNEHEKGHTNEHEKGHTNEHENDHENTFIPGDTIDNNEMSKFCESLTRNDKCSCKDNIDIAAVNNNPYSHTKFVSNKINYDHTDDTYKNYMSYEKAVTRGENFNINELNINIVDYLDIEKDKRTHSFIHICNLLKDINVENLPEYIFIENVKNFEISYSFLYFINSIKRNYFFQTYLLSPLQFGIPNERLRFYCICKKKPNLNKQTPNKTFENSISALLYSNSLIPKNYISFKNMENLRKNEKKGIFYTPSLMTFIDTNDKFPLICNKAKDINMFNKHLNEFQIKKDIFHKFSSYCFDIIDINKNGNICCFNSYEYYTEKNELIKSIAIDNNKKEEINSKKLHAMCFTSNYGRYINGSGSILYISRNKEKQDIKKSFSSNIRISNLSKENYSSGISDQNVTYTDDEVRGKKKNKKKEMKKYENKVRYFTPTEISRLMGYKMHTNENNLKENGLEKKKKNTYGNIYWNLDHVNHKCSYTINVHYCDVCNISSCLLNSGLHLTVQTCTNGEQSTYQRVDQDDKKEERDTKRERKICMCHQFEFPEFLTNRQRYKLIGNSVNVTVISLIFQMHNIFEHIL